MRGDGPGPLCSFPKGWRSWSLILPSVFLQLELSLVRKFPLDTELCCHKGWDEEGKTKLFLQLFLCGYFRLLCFAALYCSSCLGGLLSTPELSLFLYSCVIVGLCDSYWRRHHVVGGCDFSSVLLVTSLP